MVKAIFIFTFILFSLPIQARSFKDIVQKRILEESDLQLCRGDIYETGGKRSPLMGKLKKEVNAVANKGKVPSSRIWSRSFVSKRSFRNGDEIFSFAANLIKDAQQEVLIQTFIMDINGPGTKMVYDALYDLEKKQKEKGAKKPIKVKLLFDLINLFGVIDTSKFIAKNFGGFRSYEGTNFRGYGINMPRPIDPKYVELEIRFLKHKFVGANHSKTFVIDRVKGIVTGANFVSYHHTPDSKGDAESMDDHAFYFMGDIGMGLTDDFYNTFNKGVYRWKYSPKVIGRSKKTLGGGNLFGNKYHKALKKRKPAKFKVPTGPLGHFKFSHIIADWARSDFKKVEIGLVTRWDKGMWVDKSSKIFRWIREDILNIPRLVELNPQNAAFLSLFYNAKSHINIVSPSLNSIDIMNAMLDAMKRNVNVNFLLNKNYENMPAFGLRERGTNQMAAEWMMKERQKLVKRYGEDNIGQFNLKWFVNRGGFHSGRKHGGKVKKTTMKQWNHNHTKFMVADNQVAIIGSGNMDSQTWFHSGETNVVVDDYEVATRWCRDVFKTDYLRGHDFGDDHRDLGEKCFFNKTCMSGYCHRFKKWNIFNKKCAPARGRGLNGSLCYLDNQCKSGKCDTQRCK